jgi:hypothetical protein
MKRFLLMLVISMFFMVPLLAQSTGKLILVDLSKIRDVDGFSDLKIPYYHRYANYLFCVVDQKQIYTLEATSLTILDDNAWSENYYLISSNDGRKFDKSHVQGRILWENETQLLLKSRSDIISLVSQTGLSVVPISRHPSYYQQTKLIVNPIQRNIDADIQTLISHVDPDSVYRYIRTLQDFQTRFCLADTRDAVANWIADEFRSMGFTDVVLDSFYIFNTWQKNVIATLPGTTNPQQNIIIGAHSDDRISFGNTNQYIFCPGADDNASGVSAVLEAARIFKLMQYQPNCTFRFVTFACEELGSIGSYYFISDLASSNAQIKLMINHDMIAYNPDYPNDKRVLLMPYTAYEAYTDYASQVMIRYTDLIPVIGDEDSPASDSYFFSEFNYPPIYFFEYTFSPFYHSAEDIISYLDVNYCAEIIRSSIATAVSVSANPEPISDFMIRNTGTGHSLVVSWNPPEESAIDRYTIYVGVHSGIYTNSYSTSDTLYSLEGLENDTLYYIGLSCHNILGYNSFIREKTFTPSVSPNCPMNLSAEPQMHAVKLKWSPNTEIDLLGYRVFRSTIPGELSKELTRVPSSASEYIDYTTGDGVTYYYSLKAEDIDGNLSSESDQYKSCCVSLNQGILLVTGYEESTYFNYLNPSIAQTEIYYGSLLSSYKYKNFVLYNNSDIKLADMGPFSTVIWHSDSQEGIIFNQNNREELQKYLSFGGKVLFSTYKPSSLLEQNCSYPTNFHPGDFIYDIFKISSVAFSDSALFINAISNSPEIPNLSIDRLKSSNLLNYHIQNVETMRTTPQGEEILIYGSDFPPESPHSVLDGGAVGIGYFGNDYMALILSFPLWNINAGQAQEFLEEILNNRFNELSVHQEISTYKSSSSYIEKNYPNPFNPYTTISFTISEKSSIDLSIYNVRGQKVCDLIHEEFNSGTHSIRWDGKDNRGRFVGSGVYIARLIDSHSSYSIKMLLLK